MIIQACINGVRTKRFHKQVPVTVSEIVEDCISCISAGGNEIHVHPRNGGGQESLQAVDETIDALRSACPGTLIGVSTGAWIEADATVTRGCINSWSALPDYASVNLSEDDAPDIMELLVAKSVGVEAGLATLDDANRFVGLKINNQIFRVLIEIEIPDVEAAINETKSILMFLRDRGFARQVLIHGLDVSKWPMVQFALENGYSTRVGFEDGKYLPNGQEARNNAEIVETAVQMRQNLNQ